MPPIRRKIYKRETDSSESTDSELEFDRDPTNESSRSLDLPPLMPRMPDIIDVTENYSARKRAAKKRESAKKGPVAARIAATAPKRKTANKSTPRGNSGENKDEWMREQAGDYALPAVPATNDYMMQQEQQNNRFTLSAFMKIFGVIMLLNLWRFIWRR